MENLDFADVIKALRLLPGNRPIKAKKVESLIEAYKQGVPLEYKDDDSLETARLINNSQDRWKANDRLDSYVYERKEAYVRLKELMEELILISEILNTNSVFVRDHSTAWDKARDRLGISFNKFVVRLRKKADTWEEPKDSIEAWFTMYLKVAGL